MTGDGLDDLDLIQTSMIFELLHPDWLYSLISQGYSDPKHEADHPPPSLVKVKNTWSCAYMATLPKLTEVLHLNNIITLTLILKHIYYKYIRNK